VDEVVSLSLRYGIATPYTSFLVEEPQALPLAQAPGQPRVIETVVVEVEKVVEKAMEAPALGASGAEAVADAGVRKELRSAARAPVEEAKAVRHAGERTFVYRSGVWVDTAFDVNTMQATEVPFGSSRYFELAADSEVAGYLALGSQVIFVFEGQAYQITPSEEMELEAQATQPAVQPTVEQPQPPDASGFLAALLAWLQDLRQALTQDTP